MALLAGDCQMGPRERKARTAVRGQREAGGGKAGGRMTSLALSIELCDEISPVIVGVARSTFSRRPFCPLPRASNATRLVAFVAGHFYMPSGKFEESKIVIEPCAVLRRPPVGGSMA